MDKETNPTLTLFDCVYDWYINCMRTVSYPMFELSTIVDILVLARKTGKTISKQLLANIAASSQNASYKSGIFNQRLAAFKHYNLIDTDKNNLTFTPLSDMIASNDKSALKKAFLAPETFNKLHSTLEKNVELQIEILENIATIQLGITESGKKTFVNNFIKSGIYCGLIEYSLGSNREIVVRDIKQPQNIQNKTIYEEESNDFTNKQKAELKTSKGKAVIIVPEELTKEDKEKLKAQIELF